MAHQSDYKTMNPVPVLNSNAGGAQCSVNFPSSYNNTPRNSFHGNEKPPLNPFTEIPQPQTNYFGPGHRNSGVKFPNAMQNNQDMHFGQAPQPASMHVRTIHNTNNYFSNVPPPATNIGPPGNVNIASGPYPFNQTPVMGTFPPPVVNVPFAQNCFSPAYGSTNGVPQTMLPPNSFPGQCLPPSAPTAMSLSPYSVPPPHLVNRPLPPPFKIFPPHPGSEVPFLSGAPLQQVDEEESSLSREEMQLNSLIQKFNSVKCEKSEKEATISIPEFRAALKTGYSLFKMLQDSRETLFSLLNSANENWEDERVKAVQLQEKLSLVCGVLLTPPNITRIESKLKRISKKRAFQKKRKALIANEEAKKEEEKEKLHQEIDKYLDGIQEKYQKAKREKEMQKDADSILGEVRRKIHEAKRTLEKIKVFEKLRAARLANAQKKSMFVSPLTTSAFENRMEALRSTILHQLSDYEGEERALRVMLETEQEGRREEEAAWKIKKAKTLQQKRQDNIIRSLFGEIEEPTVEDPLFLFYQHQNSANMSLKNLVQIRHHWDMHIVEDGEPVPQRWVVPVAPTSSTWEDACKD